MTHYLTLAEFDSGAPEHALRPLLDPADKNLALDAHHRLIWTLFPGKEARRDFLWRAHGKGRFMILSAREPQGSSLFKPLQSKSFAPVLAKGDRLAFVLRANATMDRRGTVDEEIVPGTKRTPRKDRRVDIVMHAMRNQEREGNHSSSRAVRRMEVAEEVAGEWLVKQGEKRGFDLDNMDLGDYRVLKVGRPRGHHLTFGVLDVSGRLTVRDPEQFVDALVVGFGRAKAYGCGLMLVRRV